MTLVNPHLSFPLDFDPQTGDLAEHEQNGADDVLDAVGLISSVTLGELEFHPDFGVPDVALLKAGRGVRAGLVAQAIRVWEDRAPIAATDTVSGGDAFVDVQVDTGRLIDDAQRAKALEA